MKALTILLLICSTSGASAHSWFDPNCCSGSDCSEIVSILETPNGDYITTIDGRSATFAKDFPRRKSEDAHSYACIGSNSTPRCLYIPDLGS